MTPAEFKTRYPEFNTAPDGLVAGVITEQELLVSDSWGAKREFVLGLSVADSLSRNPKARNARVDLESQSKAVESPYSAQLAQLRKAHGWILNRT